MLHPKSVRIVGYLALATVVGTLGLTFFDAAYGTLPADETEDEFTAFLLQDLEQAIITETPESIATQVLNVLFYGLPLEQLQTFRDRVNAITVDDIQRVSRFYLKPDRLS